MSLVHSKEMRNGNGAAEAPEPFKPPNGGARAWATMIGGCLTYVATIGYTNAFGVYQDFYTRANTGSSSAISWIGSTQLFLLIAMGLVAGKLLDAGYFRPTMLAGTVLYTFSLFMVSIAHPDKWYQIFLSQGIGMGIGGGLLYTPSMAVQTHHWTTLRPLAMGVVIAGACVGGIIFPIMLNHTFSGSTGFAWGVRASAFVVLGLLMVANLLMSSRPEATRNDRPKPRLSSLLKDVQYCILVLGALCVLAGIFFPYFYLQVFAVSHGVDSTLAFYSIAIMNAASIPGRILPNAFVNRTGVFNMLIPFTFICGAFVFVLFAATNVAGTTIFAILYGVWSGAFLSLITPAIGSLARDANEVGMRIGFAYTIAALGALMGNPIEGALLGKNFSWFRPIIFSAVMMFGGGALIVVTRFMVADQKRARRV